LEGSSSKTDRHLCNKKLFLCEWGIDSFFLFYQNHARGGFGD
jgi:hypothetical protein